MLRELKASLRLCSDILVCLFVLLKLFVFYMLYVFFTTRFFWFLDTGKRFCKQKQRKRFTVYIIIQQQRLFLFSTFYGCPRDGPIYFSLSVKPFPISFLLLYTLTACVSVVPLIYVVCMLRYIFMCNVQCTVYCTPTGSPVHYVYVWHCITFHCYCTFC